MLDGCLSIYLSRFVGTVMLFLGVWFLYNGEKSVAEFHMNCYEMPHPEAVDHSLNGKIVHAIATAEAHGMLSDGLFPVAGRYTRLERKVEYLQYVEEGKSYSSSTDSYTTYTYDLQWCDEPIGSSLFHDPNYKGINEQNAIRPIITSQTLLSNDVTFGAYHLPPFLVEKLGVAEPIDLGIHDNDMNNSVAEKSVTSSDTDHDDYVKALATVLKQYTESHIDGNIITIGDGVTAGSMRVSFTYVKPVNVVSIVAMVSGDSFAEYYVEGENKSQSIVCIGEVPMGKMLNGMRQNAKGWLEWIRRLICTALIISGFKRLYDLLTLLLIALPFMTNVLKLSSDTVSWFMGIILSLILTGIVWITCRIEIGIMLFASALVMLLLLSKAPRFLTK